MKFACRPIRSPEGTPLIEVAIGAKSVTMTPVQAEDIGLALMRAATASRYESGIEAAIKGEGGSSKLAAHTIGLTRKQVGIHKVRSS